MKKQQVIRQGDVYIILNTGKPDEAQLRQDHILALGENTGHKHEITVGTVYGDLFGKQWIVVDEPTELIHDEHDTLTIPVGVHEVRIQREYTPQEIRRVRD